MRGFAAQILLGFYVCRRAPALRPVSAAMNFKLQRSECLSGYKIYCLDMFFIITVLIFKSWRWRKCLSEFFRTNDGAKQLLFSYSSCIQLIGPMSDGVILRFTS